MSGRVGSIARIAASVAVGLCLTAGIARGHQSPAGCNANRLSLDISRDQSVIFNGDTVNYEVTIPNPGAGSGVACDVTDLDVVFYCPAPDGFSTTGPSTVLTTTGNYPADGIGNNCFNSTGTGGCFANAGLSCVVTVNPGVTQANATVVAGDPAITDKTKGALHDNPNDSAFSITKSLGITVTHETRTPTLTPTETHTPTPTPTPAPTFTRTPGAPATPGPPTTPGPPFVPPKPPTKTPAPTKTPKP